MTMDQAMVEKVARATCENRHDGYKVCVCESRVRDDCRARGQKAYDLIVPPGFAVRRREPTEEMLDAAGLQDEFLRREFAERWRLAFDHPTAAPDLDGG